MAHTEETKRKISESKKGTQAEWKPAERSWWSSTVKTISFFRLERPGISGVYI